MSEVRDDIVLRDVDPTRGRRWRRVVGVVVITLLAGAAGVWLVIPSNPETARGSLSPRETGIAIDSAPSVATDRATTTVATDLTAIEPGGTPESTDPWDAMNTTAPPVAPVADNGSGYFAATSRYCMDDYTYPPCAAAVRTFCSTHRPTVWYVPSLVGRDPGDAFSASEREHAHAYAQCSLGRVPFFPSVNWECTSDSSIANRITSQDVPPGTPLDAIPRGWQVSAERECAPPTTCVLITLPPNTWDETTTTVWNCR